MQDRAMVLCDNFVFLCLLMIFLLTGCGGGVTDAQSIAPVAGGQVSGTVTDVDTSIVLSGVTVTINGQTAVSDNLGYYSFANIAVGTWSLSAVLTGYEVYSSSVQVTSGTAVVVDPAMSPSPVGPLNTPPIAAAGTDQTVTTGDLVNLSGNGSTDADGDALTYQWNFQSRPPDSLAVLNGAGTMTPDFTADITGTYEILLTVNDVTVDSSPDLVIVVASAPAGVNNKPVANAGLDRSVQSGGNVTLDGSGSTDADSDQLSYTWELIDFPPDSEAALVNETTLTPSFYVDVAGPYTVQLTVNDGLLSSAQDQVVITAVDGTNIAPVADGGADQNAIPGATIVLDGSGSSDAEGDPLSYQWSLSTTPLGSKAVLSSGNTVNSGFIADLVGNYQIQLVVSDPTVDSAIDTVTVTVAVDNQTNSQGMSFNRISAGSFSMGSPSTEIGRDDDEEQFPVVLTQDYYLMTTEVTQGQWQAVMGEGNNPSWFQSCGTDCPVETVTWIEVQTFITELNELNILTGQTYRLPTEAEWEYAARAGSETATYGGDLASSGAGTGCEDDWVLNDIAWYCGNAVLKTNAVGQKTVNPWGLYDMLGNVQEWTQDWYGDYPVAPEDDPEGPVSGTLRVSRGGGFNSRPALVRAASRWLYDPALKFSDLGFRLVWTGI